MDKEPTTELEQLLLAALGERNHHISYQKQVIRGLQAQTIFHSAHVEDLRGQLQKNEVKKAQGQNGLKLNMDGKLKILTQDMVYNGITKAHAECDA